MSFFKNESKQRNIINKQNKKISYLESQIARKDRRIAELKDLCEEKDEYFKEMISDSLKHGSKLAGKHMSDRKKYLNGK